MTENIFLTNEKIDFDVLPVGIVKNFPLEKHDYKPYTQVKLCFSSEGFELQLLAFEAKPLKESKIMLVFVINNKKLVIEVFSNNEYSIKADEIEFKEKVKYHFFTGEDLQGKYWGANLMISSSLLNEYFGNFLIKNGGQIKGNVFKICENSVKPHYGSLFQADFSVKNLYDQLGEFIITEY